MKPVCDSAVVSSVLIGTWSVSHPPGLFSAAVVAAPGSCLHSEGAERLQEKATSPEIN